jgi:hypothetical protein
VQVRLWQGSEVTHTPILRNRRTLDTPTVGVELMVVES